MHMQSIFSLIEQTEVACGVTHASATAAATSMDRADVAHQIAEARATASARVSEAERQVAAALTAARTIEAEGS